MFIIRRRLYSITVAAALVFLLYELAQQQPWRPSTWTPSAPTDPTVDLSDPSAKIIQWSKLPERYPVTSFIPLPTGVNGRIPKIQHVFESEAARATKSRLKRQSAVKKSFQRGWDSYKKYAWLRDELAPISGGYRDTFCGWAATLVDSLDTLWIMGLRDEFEQAVEAVGGIDFTRSVETDINIFETTIRYLGGLLGAYDLSEGQYRILLDKAIEMGEILYCAFDTPNRMPVTRWDWELYMGGQEQQAGKSLIAELGSLTVEFTRLSQLTGDPKYFDAIQRITNELDATQQETRLPGMWPIVVNPGKLSFTVESSFTLGGMSDSLYEYFPKQHLLLGGATEQYRKMYQESLKPIKEHIFFRPLNEENLDILLSGDAKVLSDDSITQDAKAQHLACFTGGMVGIGAKMFDQSDDMITAMKLVDGCIWAYERMATGIMPEMFRAVPCASDDACRWDEDKWHKAVQKHYNEKHGPGAAKTKEQIQKVIKDASLVPGIIEFTSPKYILRPEAIESVFILYRLTGNTTLQDKAWDMFTSITKHTKTSLANAGISDVTSSAPKQSDRMESFWLAETLKYFYLIFSEPDVVSLDEYVFNTEAHPLKLPVKAG
ncbi:MAG: hypothetical protein M1833_003563 [Piccolia ochrophora]|nr:MAG: hypothetical protein M1833_003563 [Piccolia ochrophora]